MMAPAWFYDAKYSLIDWLIIKIKPLYCSLKYLRENTLETLEKGVLLY